MVFALHLILNFASNNGKVAQTCNRNPIRVSARVKKAGSMESEFYAIEMDEMNKKSLKEALRMAKKLDWCDCISQVWLIDRVTKKRNGIVTSLESLRDDDFIEAVLKKR